MKNKILSYAKQADVLIAHYLASKDAIFMLLSVKFLRKLLSKTQERELETEFKEILFLTYMFRYAISKKILSVKSVLQK